MKRDAYRHTVYGKANDANSIEELKYETGTSKNTVQLSLQLDIEGTFMKETIELAVVKD